jgi:hypothetical protein
MRNVLPPAASVNLLRGICTCAHRCRGLLEGDLNEMWYFAVPQRFVPFTCNFWLSLTTVSETSDEYFTWVYAPLFGGSVDIYRHTKYCGQKNWLKVTHIPLYYFEIIKSEPAFPTKASDDIIKKNHSALKYICEFVPIPIISAFFREPETETSVGNSVNYLQL